ncbi:MAG: hypothetical protein EA402_12485 [Planctomycetota bacterium]|nr:MAG: hypothetical protein EA402_12485 [Planctomycetota bacterium]
MSARMIDGKQVSEERRIRLAGRVEALRAAEVQPCLVAVGMGDDHGWDVYTRNQEKACAAVGIRYWRENLLSDATQEDLAALIERLNTDSQVHGIIVQSPLPEGLDERAAQALLSPDKDVEAVNPANLGLVLQGREILAPCTARSAVALAEAALGDLRGVDTVVVGASVIVGRPLAQLLLSAGATVTVCHIDTRDLQAHTRQADLVIVAVGKAGLIGPDHIKPGATVIDVGINRLRGEDGKVRTVGDVDPAVAEVAAALSPVPGGVGAMTTTILLESTVAAAEANARRAPAMGAAGMARLLGEAGAQLPPELLERLARLLSAHIVGGSLQGLGNPLSRRLGHRMLVIDGAIGTELSAAGLSCQPLDSANLSNPDAVLKVHRAYVAAGAQALTTNTFRCNRFQFKGDRQEAIRVAQAGVRLARQAAAGRIPVLGSIGPMGPTVGPGKVSIDDQVIDESLAEEAAAEIALAMVDAGVDGFILETLPSTREARALLRGVRRVGTVPVLVSRALLRNDAEELEEFARTMAREGAAAVGVNCAGGPRQLLPILKCLAEVSSLPVFALPNAGFPTAGEDGRLSYHLDPAYFRRSAEAYMAEGACLIGGCCGVGPDHIAAIADLGGSPVQSQRPARQPARSATTIRRQGDPLLAQLQSTQLSVLAMIPGRLATAPAMAAVRALADAGCAGIGVMAAWPGGTGASGHVAARLRRLGDHAQRPAILELPAAAIDLATAEAALADAHELGIRHILIDAGVFSHLVSDRVSGVDPLQLLHLVGEGNRGFDLRGVRQDEAWEFTVGVRLPASWANRAAAMQSAGADFVSLQPIYEPQAFRQAMAQIAESGCTLPLLAEVLVLPDAETAEELNYEVPVLSVPERLRERLRSHPDEDVAGVLRFLRHWHGRLAGVVLMLPDARTVQAEAVLRGLGRGE